ncbi:MAG: NYN domain-containing protein [Solirubrobacterales bacterium]
MRLVVDAMNVIGSVPDGWWRDREGATARLLAALESYAAEHPEERVTMVLEREPRRLPAGARVEVLWAARAGRDAADEEIARRLPGWAGEEEVTVVTSDRALAERAEGAGAAVRPARAFRRTLSW